MGSCNRLFIELLQVSIGAKDSISREPSETEWRALYAVAFRLSLTGILFCGVEQLGKQGTRPPQDVLLQWLGVSEQIRQRNNVLKERSKSVLRLLSEHNIYASILKGQGLTRYYPNKLKDLRLSGDIDVYVDCEFKKVISFTQELAAKETKWDYRHTHVDLWDDTEVEIHYRPEMLLNLNRNRRLQRWFDRNKGLMFEERDELMAPSLNMNVFYVLLHIYRHYLFEGIGLKQMLDYYFVLRTANGNVIGYEDGESIIDVLQSFGMLRFARGVMWIMQELFLMKRKDLYCDPLEREGRCIFNRILSGKLHKDYKRRGKLAYLLSFCKNNAHLLRYHPSEVLWDPIWVVWHKCWKIGKRFELRDNKCKI